MTTTPQGLTDDHTDKRLNTENTIEHARRAETPTTPTMVQISPYEEQLCIAMAELEIWQGRAERRRTRVRELEAELLRSKAHSEYIEDKLRTQQETIICLQDYIHQLSSTKEQHREEKRLTRSLEQQLVTEQAAHASTNSLLKTRSSELEDAQKFLTRTDPLSDADILRMVEHLNSQIFQAAARIADSVTFLPSTPTTGRPEAHAGQLVGPKLANLLRHVSHTEDFVCVQLALQTGMVSWTIWLVETWSFDPQGDDELFHAMYAHIKEKG